MWMPNQHLDSMVLEVLASLKDSLNLQNPKQSPLGLKLYSKIISKIIPSGIAVELHKHIN